MKLLILLLSFVCTYSTIATEDCISTYSQLENFIVNNSMKCNLDKMLRAFFPPNKQPPAALDIIYHVEFLSDDKNNSNCKKIVFHWSQFLALEVIEPELLGQLSYFIYHRHYDHDTYGELDDLDIYVPVPFCSQYTCPDSDRFEQNCNEENINDTHPLALLNLFTTQVSHI